jgi:hypothetical protein
MLGESVPELLGSYRSVGGLNKRDENNLPSLHLRIAFGKPPWSISEAALTAPFALQGHIVYPEQSVHETNRVQAPQLEGIYDRCNRKNSAGPARGRRTQ